MAEKKKVVVADDEPFILSALQDTLSDSYSVFTASNLLLKLQLEHQQREVRFLRLLKLRRIADSVGIFSIIEDWIRQLARTSNLSMRLLKRTKDISMVNFIYS